MLPNLTPVVKNLIIINVLMLLAASAEIPFFEALEGKAYISDLFRPWQIITHMFMHADFRHLLFNMFGLFFFGTALERYFGAKKFLFYYLSCGIGAFLLYQLTQFIQIQFIMDSLSLEEMEWAKEGKYNTMNPASEKFTSIYYPSLVGASGAIFGLLIGFAMKFPETRVQLLFPPIPLTAKQLAIGYGVIEILMAVANVQGDNVAHTVHLLGGLMGYLIIKYWEKNNNQYRYN